MRYIHISNPSLTQTVKFYMSIGADAPGTRIFDGLVLPPTSVFPHHCLHVIATSESVQAWADIANVLVLTMTGEQVSG